MPDTGWKSPSTNGAKGVRNVWSNPALAYVSDNAYATRADDGTSDQDHSWETFNFSIPGGQVIDGIEVSIEGKASVAGTIYVSVWNQSWGTGFVGTKSLILGTGEATQVLGNSSDYWGIPSGNWLPSDFSNANFAVGVYTDVWPGTGEIHYIDHIRIRVYYHEAPPNTPTNIKCEGVVNPTNVSDSTPELRAEYDNGNTGDTASAYQVQVIEEGGTFSSPLWDSGKQSCSVPEGSYYEVSYGGTPLAFDSKKYFQRWKYWSASDLESPWSDGSDFWFMSYSLKSSPVSPGDDAKASQYNDLRDDVLGPHHRVAGGSPIIDADVDSGYHLLTQAEWNVIKTHVGL